MYRQHWWRCDGPCQNRKPFFGYVKRAMNRAPAPRDPWWNEHKSSCGGTFYKIKEPEKYSKKKEPKKLLSNKSQPTINSLFRKVGNDLNPGTSENENTPVSPTGAKPNMKSLDISFRGKGRKLTEDIFEINVKRRRIPGLFEPGSGCEPQEICYSDSDDDLDTILEDRRKQIDKKMQLNENRKKKINPNKRKLIENSSNLKKPCIWLNDESVSAQSFCDCPACGMMVIESLINQHLDICLK